MNHLLQLKGSFTQAKWNGKVGAPPLPAGAVVKLEHLIKLRNDLQKMYSFWSQDSTVKGALVSAYYSKVAAKSNRIKYLLANSSNKANETVVGARFSDTDSPKHIITHYVGLKAIERSIELLEKCEVILQNQFNGVMSKDTHDNIGKDAIKWTPKEISKTTFLQLIKEAHYIEKFDILLASDETRDQAVITLFKTEESVTNVLKSIGIDLPHTSILDETTILLQPDDILILKQNAPYLIAMAVSDLSDIPTIDFAQSESTAMQIPSPKNEPIIGVIDTLFDESVYFSEWVEYHNRISPHIPTTQADAHHGTAISSIIVDGHTINPDMDDGCGRFRVRHFGVALAKQFSSFSVLREISDIITKNRDIKVWNLSLGSKFEINRNFMSPEAALLDKIQYENDVIFVIAGTNKPKGSVEKMRIGAPADSINSLVVNSVTSQKEPVSYARRGPVLSFFTKPDLSYYGGDSHEELRVCTPTGEGFVVGTSFAAPWISRKLSYLIDILGMTREVAKALIVHVSTGWEKQEFDASIIGHGIVPLRVEDIVESPEDEIRFYVSGISEKYKTYTYNLPVPVAKEKHPFVAKATLCYFPCCSRNQGVDYTNTELDFSFGRIGPKSIKPINNNYQSDESVHFTYEEQARELFRKWDNVKHLQEVYSSSVKDKKAYSQNGLWGISLTTKERLEEKFGENLKFGIVVSLKEIHGENRIEEFIYQCSLRAWLVNKIEIENRVNIYNIAEEVIEFDD